MPEGYDLPTLELYEDEPLVQSKPSAATPSHDIKVVVLVLVWVCLYEYTIEREN